MMVKELLQTTHKQRRKSKDVLEKEIAELSGKLERLDDKFVDGDIDKDTYRRLYGKYNPQLQALKTELQEQRSENEEYSKYLNSGINLLKDLKGFYHRSDIHKRKKLLGSIFPENLELEKKGSRTARINEAVRQILATGKGSVKNKTGQLFENLELSGQEEVSGVLSNRSPTSFLLPAQYEWPKNHFHGNISNYP